MNAGTGRRELMIEEILDKGVDFLYEFKDYNMLYYMPISSNPPLGFMETTSVLMSRKQLYGIMLKTIQL